MKKIEARCGELLTATKAHRQHLETIEVHRGHIILTGDGWATALRDEFHMQRIDLIDLPPRLAFQCKRHGWVCVTSEEIRSVITERKSTVLAIRCATTSSDIIRGPKLS